VPLLYRAKGEISTSHQVKLYQAMNASAHPENIKQLPKILWRSITGKHNRIHGCQRFLTTIDCFSDMLSTILQKNDGVDQPKRCWYLSTPSQEPQSARNPDDPRRQDSSKSLQDIDLSIQNQRSTAKTQGGFKKTHIATARKLIQ
jgi:hypothetical protein